MIASHLVDPNHLKISWADIAGLDSVIEQIKKTVIYPVLAQQRIVRVSRLIQPPKGILLYGPPGGIAVRLSTPWSLVAISLFNVVLFVSVLITLYST